MPQHSTEKQDDAFAGIAIFGAAFVCIILFIVFMILVSIQLANR